MQTKFTLVLAAMLCAAVTTKAQVSKGNTILGGNLGFSSNKQTDEAGNKTTNTYFSIAPSLGFVYKDNKVLGFIAKYAYAGNGESSDLNTSSFGAGVYLRQYKPLGKGFYVFAQEALNADFNHFRSVYASPDIIQDQKQANIYIAVNPGLAYDFSKKLQLEVLFFNNLLSAGYSSSNIKYETSDVYNDYKISNFYAGTSSEVGLWGTVNIGAKIVLGR